MTEDYFKKNNIKLPSINEADNQDNPPVVAHFQKETWHWYIIGGDKLSNNDYYLYALVDGDFVELGMVTLKQILSVGAELDTNWKQEGLYDIKKRINQI